MCTNQIRQKEYCSSEGLEAWCTTDIFCGSQIKSHRYIKLNNPCGRQNWIQMENRLWATD
jgi:hypothetical protein